MSKKSGILAGVLLAALVVFAGIWYVSRPAAMAGEKDLTIQVVHGDGTKKEYMVTTTAKYLAEVLLEQELARGSQGPYGLYIQTVDGETADEANQEWWCITRGGESVMTGADETPVADDERYELTLTVGYGS